MPKTNGSYKSRSLFMIFYFDGFIPATIQQQQIKFISWAGFEPGPLAPLLNALTSLDQLIGQ
jgi:hypothetical protein